MIKQLFLSLFLILSATYVHAQIEGLKQLDETTEKFQKLVPQYSDYLESSIDEIQKTLDKLIIDSIPQFQEADIDSIKTIGEVDLIQEEALNDAPETEMTETFESLSVSNEETISSRVRGIRIVMLVISLAVFLWAIFWRRSPIRYTFGEIRDGIIDNNGMKRLFVFNFQPYKLMLLLCLAIVCSILLPVVTFTVIGVLSWGCLGLLKLLLFAIVWIGIIATLVGGLMICMSIYHGLWICTIGILIWYNDETIENFGRKCYDIGYVMLHDFNMLEYGKHLFSEYWIWYVGAIAAPILVFLSIAILIMIFAFLLGTTEFVITSIYGVSHRCPYHDCSRSTEPAIYLSNGIPLPDEVKLIHREESFPYFSIKLKRDTIKLRPGKYGLFYITHPKTKERMPTLLLNGRDKLTRLCHSCGKPIYYQTGEEKSIAVIGAPASGKSTLVCRLVGLLMNENTYIHLMNVGRLPENVKKSIEDVRLKGYFVSSVAKTQKTKGSLSVELSVPRNGGGFPYRLMVDDVAGELYTVEATKRESLRFFNHTDEIIFIIDPEYSDFSQNTLSEPFKTWHMEHKKSTTYKLRNILDIIFNQLQHENADIKKIHFSFVLSKCDMGYINSKTIKEDNIKNFICKEIDCEDTVRNVENKFKTVHYYAVSALSQSIEDSKINTLKAGILKDLGIK